MNLIALLTILNLSRETIPNIELCKEFTRITSAYTAYIQDKELIYAIIKTESNFNPKAISPAAAKGLMQVTQVALTDAIRTCNLQRRLDLLNPVDNLIAGMCYLTYALNKTEEDPIAAIILYNGGFRQYTKLIEGQRLALETEFYVNKVLQQRSLCVKN